MPALRQLRVWGLGLNVAATEDEIVALALDVGFVDMSTEPWASALSPPHSDSRASACDRSHGEALAYLRPARRFLLSQVDEIWQHGMIDYLLLRARKPAG